MSYMKYIEPMPLDIRLEGNTHPRINLSTSEDIRREMARIYRDARALKINTNDGTKLVYILTQILKAHELFILEKRLVQLEQLNSTGGR